MIFNGVVICVGTVAVVCLGWGAFDVLRGAPFKRKPTAPAWVQIVDVLALVGVCLWLIARFLTR